MINSRALIVACMVFLFFCVLVFKLAFIMIIPEGKENYAFIILPTSIILALAVYIMKLNPIDIKKIQEAYLKSSQKNQIVISIVFSRYVKNKYHRTIAAVIVAMIMIAYLCIALNLYDILMYADSIMLFYCFCLIVRSYFISFRISEGLYGTNANEAKELLKFILKHSDDIDFKDKEGGLKDIFKKEDFINIIPDTEGNLGEVYP